MNVTENEKAVTYCNAFEFNANDKVLNPVLLNNQPFFVAIEVCAMLGLANVTSSLNALDEDEKLTYETHRSGQKRKINLVNESGLYNLIFRSNKPEAKAFRKWVTQEVLPAIRKTGAYKPANDQKLLAPPRKHNRLTQSRIVDILADVAKIEDSLLRKSLVAKILGGQPS